MDLTSAVRRRAGRGVVAAVLALGGGVAQAATPLDLPALAAEAERRAVVVDPPAARALPREAAARVERRIARQAPGRIRVVVLRPSAAPDLPALRALANGLDAAIGGVEGALLTTTGEAWWVVTSHDRSSAAEGVVRGAVTREGLEARLLAAVDGLAAVDPGPEAVPDLEGAVKGGVAIAALVLAALVGIPVLLLVAGLLWVRRRRRRVADAGRLGRRAELTDLHLALGDGLRELDLDVELPSATGAAKVAYADAVAAYEAAGAALEREDLPRAADALATGTAAIERARAALAADRAFGGPSSPYVP
jgi:hypothetical protein